MEIIICILLGVIIGFLWRISELLKDIEFYLRRKYGLMSRKTYEKIERESK